ncbi:MAG: hypothetical protein JO054_00930 [Actinobacteria bacterium]|nr:hypothetical protein [Actinomycetota bacterium]
MQKLLRSASFAVGVALCVATVFAAPAAARHHHHNHDHTTCGPGTALQQGVCVFVDPPVGDSNVTITPNPVPLSSTGAFVATLTVKGALPQDVLKPDTSFGPKLRGRTVCGRQCALPCLGPDNVPCGPPPKVGPIACGPGTAIQVTPSPLVADSNGTAVGTISSGGGSCVAGTYPISVTETASPFRTFTGFLVLTN